MSAQWVDAKVGVAVVTASTAMCHCSSMLHMRKREAIVTAQSGSEIAGSAAHATKSTLPCSTAFAERTAGGR